MAALSGEQIAQIFYQAGFRGEALNEMVAISKRESSWDPAAHRTSTNDPNGSSGDFGLAQVNYSNAPALIKAGIITTTRDLLDPVKNAQAAFFLSHSGTSFASWGIEAGVGWVAGGNPLTGTNISAARTVVASAASQGLIGQDYSSGGAVPNQSGGGATNNAGSPSLTPTSNNPTGATTSNFDTASLSGVADGATGGTNIAIPTDAKFVSDYNGTVFAVFDVGGAKVAYDIQGGQTDLSGKQITSISQDEWKSEGIVNGGNVAEVADIKQKFGSYNGFFNAVLAQVMGPNNPAANDPTVRAVLVEKASRPDMTDPELTNKLAATDWYQQHTQGQLNWNGLGDAEKTKERQDAAAQMVTAWEQDNGGSIDPSDPRIQNDVENVASGKISIGSWQQNVSKAAALGNDASPYAQGLKTQGINVSNAAGNIRLLLTKWGLQWSEGTIQKWAADIVNKNKSDDDLTQQLKTQAQVLYPWKDPEMDTTSAAAPWTETYQRVMEQPASLTNPDIQKSLTAGQQPWAFEQDLKKSTGWLNTKNARDTLTNSITNVGKMMGFA